MIRFRCNIREPAGHGSWKPASSRARADGAAQHEAANDARGRATPLPIATDANARPVLERRRRARG